MKRVAWVALVIRDVAFGMEPGRIVVALSFALTAIVVGWCAWELVQCVRS